jgi:hypothetical protein
MILARGPVARVRPRGKLSRRNQPRAQSTAKSVFVNLGVRPSITVGFSRGREKRSSR